MPPVPAERKIITSEEEAKARIAEKRKEMKVSWSSQLWGEALHKS